MGTLVSRRLTKTHCVQSNSGFTLLEVIIALAILSIALTSIIISSTELVRNIDYLRNKTLATWVASNIINEAKVGLIQPPQVLKPIYGQVEMLNTTWKWRLRFSKISTSEYQVTADVGKNEEYNDVSLISFVRSS